MPASILITFSGGDRERFYAPDEEAYKQALKRLIDGEADDENRIHLWTGVSVDADAIEKFEAQ